MKLRKEDYLEDQEQNIFYSYLFPPVEDILAAREDTTPL